MNYALILKLIGNLLRIEAAFLLVPLCVSLIYKSGDANAFLLSILILAVLGALLLFVKPKDKRFKAKDGFACAALSWVAFSFGGALPFYFSGCFGSFIDCIFESVSGFTTTGATILFEVESLPAGISFWRCFTHWLGGMGVLVFLLAVMPSMNASSVNLMRAESTGPTINKVAPKLRETARAMYIIYFVMTVVLVLLLLSAGLSLFDSLTHSFSVAGTGGFSPKNISVGEFDSALVENIISLFMFLFGVSFALYYAALMGGIKRFFTDEELISYFGVVAVSAILIAFDVRGIYGSFPVALRHSVFQVTSVISTTGFSTVDYGAWPTFSQIIIIFLMVTGCCAGSTGGGIKIIRLVILMKATKIEISKLIHPKIIKTVTVNRVKKDDDTVKKVGLFFFIYFTALFICTALVSIDRYDVLTSITAVIAALSNNGPGLGLAGPYGTFGIFSPFSKAVLTFCMIAGRLEFYPVLILFMPSIWKDGGV